jgi:flagellar biosynthetic protein FliQ
MNDSGVLELALRCMSVAGMICAPVLGFGLIVGLLVSIFQAATQINEMTLTFVPKLVACGAALIIFGPWMLRSLMSFTTNLFTSIPSLAK